ncbi:MAG: alpha/beta hydrolase-fold protein [Pseudomonadales bacterium]
MSRALALMLLLAAAGAHPDTGPEAGPESPAPPAGALYRAVTGADMPGYLLHLPDGYDTSTADYPLLFFLHGIVQKGNGSAASLEKVADHGPFRTMRDGHWDRSLPLIVVGPQSAGVQPWWRGHEVRQVLDHVRSTYRVDTRRVYLTGISMGGRSVWWLARNFAGEFAAVVPVSAWAGDLNGTCDVFRDMGIWAFHGERDPLIRLASGRRPVEALNACAPPLTPAPRLTVLADAGHGQGSRGYGARGDDGRDPAPHGDTDGKAQSDIYRWMLGFSR